MAFTGRDYHVAFEQACERLVHEQDPEEVRSQLEGIEWILWEAIRGVFFYAGIMIAGILILPIRFIIDADLSFVEETIIDISSIAIMAIVATVFYWLFRSIFYFEVATHVKGRKFGSGGIE